jgi:RNA polymerase sigma-70 factor (ECF subfamily)
MLVKRYQQRLAALALLITGSAASADDIVQETFVRAYDARIRNRSGSVSGFLGTIAYRLAVKESKRLQRNVSLDVHDMPATGSNPLANILHEERDRFVAESIHALDDGHRDVLVLHYYGDKSYEEIAELLQIPLGTVKSRMFYAVKSCRKILRQKGIL